MKLNDVIRGLYWPVCTDTFTMVSEVGGTMTKQSKYCVRPSATTKTGALRNILRTKKRVGSLSTNFDLVMSLQSWETGN